MVLSSIAGGLTKSINSNTKLITFNTKIITFNTKFIVFDTGGLTKASKNAKGKVCERERTMNELLELSIGARDFVLNTVDFALKPDGLCTENDGFCNSNAQGLLTRATSLSYS